MKKCTSKANQSHRNRCKNCVINLLMWPLDYDLMMKIEINTFKFRLRFGFNEIELQSIMQ